MGLGYAQCAFDLSNAMLALRGIFNSPLRTSPGFARSCFFSVLTWRYPYMLFEKALKIQSVTYPYALRDIVYTLRGLCKELTRAVYPLRGNIFSRGSARDPFEKHTVVPFAHILHLRKSFHGYLLAYMRMNVLKRGIERILFGFLSDTVIGKRNKDVSE